MKGFLVIRERYEAKLPASSGIPLTGPPLGFSPINGRPYPRVGTLILPIHHSSLTLECLGFQGIEQNADSVPDCNQAGTFWRAQ